MEQLVETVDLDIEESNELAFRIKIEGTSAAPAKVRLVCEGSDISYMFNGYANGNDGVVSFQLPQMKDKIKEGLYKARVEVLIENRYFAPVQFQLNFKKTLSVMAEAIQIVRKPIQPEISVVASPIQVKQVPQKQVVLPQQPAQISQRNLEKEHATIGNAQNTSKTLKERYESKKPHLEKSALSDEDLVRRIARGFIRSSKLSPGIFFTTTTVKFNEILSLTPSDKFFTTITYFTRYTRYMSCNRFIC